MDPPDASRAIDAVPSTGAVIVHEPAGDSIATVDFTRGEAQPVGAPGARLKGLVYSPDGMRLAYASGRSLRVHREGVSPDRDLVERLEAQALTQYAFSPDNRWIAAAAPGELVLVPLTAAAEGAPKRVPLDHDPCRITDLRWSLASDTVILLCAPLPGSTEPRILGVSPVTGAFRTLPAPGASRMLGFRPSGEMVVARTAGAAEEASILVPTGEIRPLRPAQENEFILLYLGVVDRFVIVKGSEDQGDPTILCTAGPPPDPCVPWLTAHPRVADVSFSQDGRWAVFVDRPAVEADLPGGDVYMAASQGSVERQVLKATAERSYSSPVLRPPRAR